jgi:zinc/manganese transport system substrate-binding protein/manganese/iron transport system substrate-binding protein
MRIRSLLCLAALVTALGCGTKPAPSASGKPRVVATFSVLNDFVRIVAGDRVEIVTLVGPDGDAHEFQPTPQDIAAIGKADLVFENGAGFETNWFDKAYAASGAKGKRVKTAEGLTLLEGAGEPDPHVWHDPHNAMHMIDKVRDGLCELDPPNAAAYRANAELYLKQLHELDKWVSQELERLPKERRKLVTSHDTFGYFAKRYGFTIVGSVLPSFSTEAADPSASAFAELVAKVKAESVPAIFCETSHNAKLVNRLAEAAGVKVAPPLYTDSLGAAGSPGGTYLGMMRSNVATISAALQP